MNYILVDTYEKNYLLKNCNKMLLLNLFQPCRILSLKPGTYQKKMSNTQGIEYYSFPKIILATYSWTIQSQLQVLLSGDLSNEVFYLITTSPIILVLQT